MAPIVADRNRVACRGGRAQRGLLTTLDEPLYLAQLVEHPHD